MALQRLFTRMLPEEALSSHIVHLSGYLLL
jgi:hypothetical protein